MPISTHIPTHIPALAWKVVFCCLNVAGEPRSRILELAQQHAERGPKQGNHPRHHLRTNRVLRQTDQRRKPSSRDLTAPTSGAMDDGGNGDTLLTLTSHNTKRSASPGVSVVAPPSMKSQSHSNGN